MAEDLEAEDKPCCASLKTKCLKLRTKCVNLEERKNQFRNAANLVQKQYDAIEQQNATLKQALEDLEVQVSRWKDEKEKETGIRVDLEDEVSALKEEIQLLKQNGRSGPGEADGKHHECLDSVEKEMNRMKDLFEKEKGRADLEKKNAEMQRKKADDALKKLEKEKKKASEAQGVANTEKKNAEKNRILLEKLKNENDALKSEMASEGSKSEAADEKLQAEKQETIKARQLAEMNMKKAEDYKLRWEKVKLELDALKSILTSERLKSEAAEKKVVAEKQETINARKLAEMNMKKAEDYKLHLEKMKTELNGVKSMLTSERLKSEAAEKKLEAEKQETIKSRELAEMNMKKSENYKSHLEKMKSELNGVKSMLTSERLKSEAAKKKLEVEKQNTSREKNRADDLTKKLEQESTRAKELEEGFCGHVCSKKLVEAHAATPGAAKSKQLANNISEGTADDDAHSSQMIKMLLEKDQNVSKEKSRADSETKKAKKLQKAAKEHKMRALQEKYRADLLSKELEGYKLRLKQLGKEQQEFLAYDIFADNSQRCDNIYESETMKLLKNQLKLEKMLTKHAKEATKLEVFRNNMLHQELLLLKKECLRFQQRLDMLDDSFLNDSEGIHGLEKVGNQIFSRDKFYPDELLASGIDSRLNHPCRGSKRNILQSSAINSSSASIDDQSLVGSPRSGTYCVMTSAKMGDISNPDATGLKFCGLKRMRYSDNDVAAAENIRSTIRASDTENSDRRSDSGVILDALVSAENLHLKGQKLHQLVPGRTQMHGLVTDQKVGHTSEIIQEDSCEKLLRPFKRRKSSCDRAVINPPHEPSDLMLHTDIDDSDASVLVASPVTDIMKLDQCSEGRMADILRSNQRPPTGADLGIDDYMKLLDLDNEADEKLYCQAITSPLSPTLPDIEFYEDESNEVDDPEILVDKCSQKEVSFMKDNLGPISTVDAYDMEKELSTNLVPNELVSSKLLREDAPVEFMESIDIFHAHVHQSGVSGENLSILNVSCSGNEEMTISCGRRMTSIYGNLLKCYVISSDNGDSHSILRILQVISRCMPQCCLLDSTDLFLQNLITNLNAEDVSMKERVCVIFCIMLHALSGIETGSSSNALSDEFISSLASITLPIHTALSGSALRDLFVESCDLAELLALVEDFIQQRKILVCDDSSAEMQVPCGAKLNLDLNGKGISLYERAASDHQLVVSGALFASIGSGIGHIGLVCEASRNIFSMEKFDPAVALAVFHAFAHTCGSKYFNLHNYALSMTVIKSLVMFLEKHASSKSALSRSKTASKIWLCSTSCPFSEGALSVESVASLLINKLQVYGRSVSWARSSRKTMNSLIPGVYTHEERAGDSDTRAVVPLSTSEENLFSFMDILSLVEILASFMGWDWTNDNFIGQFCAFFESHIMEDSSAAIFILLGQLGRLGVAARGYEDTGVKKLRERLSALFHQCVFSNLSSVTQSAVVTAVLGLTPIKFENIVQSKETVSALSKSNDAKFIRKWFSLLSKEQQAFFRLQHTESGQVSAIPTGDSLLKP